MFSIHRLSSSSQSPSDGGENTKSDLDLWDAVAMETTQMGASGDRVCKRALAIALGGRPPQERLSAIPPNTTTLNAFKSLLLRRSDLLAATRKRAKPALKKCKKQSAGASAPAVKLSSSSAAYSNKVKVKEYLAAKKSSVEHPGGATVAESMTETSEETSTAQTSTAQTSAAQTSAAKSTVVPPGGATVAESMTETSEETSMAQTSTAQTSTAQTSAVQTLTAQTSTVQTSTVRSVAMSTDVPPGGATVVDSMTETSEETSMAQTSMTQVRQTGGYELLRERMRALFLWPVMLSAIPLNGLETRDARKTKVDVPTDSENKTAGRKRKSKTRCVRNQNLNVVKFSSLETFP